MLKNNSPFWSVMIPTYRPNFGYLKQTLESVLQQDPGPEKMQIEVVDDCSPEIDVSVLVHSIAGERVDVSQTPRNLGLAGCWNACIERAKGELVHILHQDDLVLPGFYKRLGDAAEKHPNIGLLATRSFYMNDLGSRDRATPRVRKLEKGGYSVDEFLHRNPLQCAGVTVRRQVYEAYGGYRSDMNSVLDWEMWTRIIGKAGGVIVPEILACWRLSTEQESERISRSGDYLRDLKTINELFSKEHPGYNSRKAMRSACNQALDLAEKYHRSGDIAAANINRDFWEEHSWPTLKFYRKIRRYLLPILRRNARGQSAVNNASGVSLKGEQ